MWCRCRRRSCAACAMSTASRALGTIRCGMACRRTVMHYATRTPRRRERSESPLLVKILMGHSLGSSDVTEVYMSSEMLRVPLRAAQRRISAELLKLLGLGAAQY
jgi:hypothetical protein